MDKKEHKIQVNPGRIKSMINFPLYFPTLKIGCFIYLTKFAFPQFHIYFTRYMQSVLVYYILFVLLLEPSILAKMWGRRFIVLSLFHFVWHFQCYILSVFPVRIDIVFHFVHVEYAVEKLNCLRLQPSKKKYCLYITLKQSSTISIYKGLWKFFGGFLQKYKKFANKSALISKSNYFILLFKKNNRAIK